MREVEAARDKLSLTSPISGYHRPLMLITFNNSHIFNYMHMRGLCFEGNVHSRSLPLRSNTNKMAANPKRVRKY